jgi:hypothetical protein
VKVYEASWFSSRRGRVHGVVLAGPSWSLPYSFSLALAAVAGLAAGAGAFYPDIFRDSAMTAGNAQGTDLGILLLAIPTLLVSMLLVAAALFAWLWLSDIVPAMLRNTTPASLKGVTMLTNLVQVLDLSLTLPLMILAAVWLWQDRARGYLLAGFMLVMLAIETTSVATDQVSGHLCDGSASLGAVPVMIVLTVIGLVPATLLPRAVDAASVGEPARRAVRYPGLTTRRGT